MNGWKAITDEVKDGRLLLLALDNRDPEVEIIHAIDDTEGFPRTIGHWTEDPDLPEGGFWQFAGWCWSHDHFTQGIGGTPILYQELPPIPDARDLPNA